MPGAGRSGHDGIELRQAVGHPAGLDQRLAELEARLDVLGVDRQHLAVARGGGAPIPGLGKQRRQDHARRREPRVELGGALEVGARLGLVTVPSEQQTEGHQGVGPVGLELERAPELGDGLLVPADDGEHGG